MIQAGDLLLVSGAGGISKAIEVFSDSPYSHAAIVLPAWDDQLLVLQAWTFGIEIVPLSRALSQFSGPVDVFRAKAPLDLAAFRRAALAFVGRPYDYFGILRLALAILFGFRKTAQDRRTCKLFCSEYAQKVYRAGGVELTDIPDQMVEPGDLARSRVVKYVGTLGIDA